MSDIRCAFEGHACRRSVCQGKATGFFRTAKGTIWPLCEGCCQQHKTVAMKLIHGKSLETGLMIAATFDIPLDDVATRAAFQVQDPERVARVIKTADAAFSVYGPAIGEA